MNSSNFEDLKSFLIFAFGVVLTIFCIIGVIVWIITTAQETCDYVITVDPMEEGKENIVYNADYYYGSEGFLNVTLLNGDSTLINAHVNDIFVTEVEEDSLNETTKKESE